MFIRKKKLLKWLKEYEKSNQWHLDNERYHSEEQKNMQIGFDDAISATIVKIEQNRNRWSFDPIKFNELYNKKG